MRCTAVSCRAAGLDHLCLIIERGEVRRERKELEKGWCEGRVFVRSSDGGPVMMLTRGNEKRRGLVIRTIRCNPFRNITFPA